MIGIRDDAGRYSSKIRIIPDTKITLTRPEDIPEEVEYWVSKYAEVKSIYDIAPMLMNILNLYTLLEMETAE